MLNWDVLRVTDTIFQPFPHVLAENVFQEEDYQLLLQTIPPSEVYDAKIKNERGKAHRLDCPLGSLDSDIWRALDAELRSDDLWHWVRKRFERLDLPDYGMIDIRLFQDLPGYYLAPHTDAKSKIVTLIFYLAQNRQHAALGTRLYTAAEDTLPNTQLVSYRPNTMLGFVRSATSWHGCRPISGTRNTLQVIYRSATTGK